MNKIIYYVASSLDGYIAGPNADISLFTSEGNGVAYYLEDLQNFKTVIMGRKTYEFGYDFGLKPGEPAYPHMEHFIFSKSLKFSEANPQVHVESLSKTRIENIRDQSETNVYLCGGGAFAGWLLDNQLIDQIKLKLNPIVLGGGVPLFGKSTKALTLNLLETLEFDHGLRIMTYDVYR